MRRRSSLDSRQCSRPRGHGRATRATPRREVASCAGAPRVTFPAFFATSAAFALSSALPTPRVASAPTTRASSDATREGRAHKGGGGDARRRIRSTLTSKSNGSSLCCAICRLVAKVGSRRRRAARLRHCASRTGAPRTPNTPAAFPRPFPRELRSRPRVPFVRLPACEV